MVLTLSGMVTDARLVHDRNASVPMEVTPLPMVTEVRAVHRKNAKLPMEVTLSGMMIEVMLALYWKEFAPMATTGNPPRVGGNGVGVLGDVLAHGKAVEFAT